MAAVNSSPVKEGDIIPGPGARMDDPSELLFPFPYLEKRWQICKWIGTGKHSTVWLAKDLLGNWLVPGTLDIASNHE